MKVVERSQQTFSSKDLREARRFLERISSRHMNPLKRIKKIYEYADKEWSKRYASRATCKKGCGHCCHVNIGITAYEAQYIAVTHKVDLDASDVKRLNFTGVVCPFLVDNCCSIYEVRPMVCRVFASFEPVEKCIGNDQEHAIITVMPPGEGCNDIINNLYEIIKRYNDKNPIKDIRQFFKAMKKAPDLLNNGENQDG